MAKNAKQPEALTEKVIGKYELVFDSPKMKGRGQVHVTSFGPNETHSLVFNHQTIGTFVNRTSQHQDEGRTYYEKDTLGKGNLLAGAFALHLLKRATRLYALARRKRLGK